MFIVLFVLNCGIKEIYLREELVLLLLLNNKTCLQSIPVFTFRLSLKNTFKRDIKQLFFFL